MRFGIWIFICVFICVPANASTQKVYVWRDENGTLVFSDSPKPGTKLKEVKLTQSPTLMPAEDTSILETKKPTPAQEYVVNITQPNEEQTIRNNAGSVYVSGKIEPVFQRGFTVQLYLDGQPYQKPQSRAVYLLQNLDRGAHNVRLELLDASGKVIASSQVRTFYLHRASVLSPGNG